MTAPATMTRRPRTTPRKVASTPSPGRTGTRSSRPPDAGQHRRRAPRRQHGPAAPVHARRASAGPHPGRRDGHRGPARSSATCTPASRRTWSSAPGPRASRSSPGWTTCRRCSTRPPTAWAWRSCSASPTEIPERATVIRVLMMELNRISSHLVAIGTFGLELGATTVILYGFREREKILDLFELITGLRMNHAYIRPGGVAQDLPAGAVERIREFLAIMPQPAQRDPHRCSTRTRSTWPGPRTSPTSTCGLHVARRHRPGPAGRRPALGPAQVPALLRLRDLRLRRAHPDHLRRLRPVPHPDGRDATSRCGSSSSAWTGCPAPAGQAIR